MVAYNGYGDPGAGAVQPKNIARMPVLKEITSSSTVSWCPLETHKDLLAAGTVSGTIDDSFQTSSRLMILNASLSDGSGEMQLKGQARVKDADFVRISWGAKGHSDSSMPLGLIAGGMSDGSVLLWDADNIIKGTTRTPIAAKRHGSHVSGLAFHPTEQNLIASGSADSELLIWDLKNVSSPSASPPGSAVATEKSSIVDIAWNLKVAHILACSSSNGQTSVWDLRQKRAVITFTESTHRHIPATALAWDPTQARQLVVSYAYPAAEVWDLRYGMAPKQILQGGHSRGSILTVAWSQFDSNVILTTGEDATTCLWNSQDGQLLDCVQDHGTTFCLKWHPFNAELLAGSTYEGNVTVRSISNTGSHVPEWKGRPCGGIFGFGSRLVTFGNGFTRSTVRSFKVSTEPEFVRMASEFQNDISQIDMKTFCSQKIARSDAHSDERATWEFLRILFDSDSRSRFLSHLGFPPKTLHKPNAPSMPEGVSARVERLDDVSDEDFFNQLSPERIDSKAQPDSFSGLFSPINDALLSAESLQQEESDEDASDLDKEINTLLVVGEIEKATHLCFKNKRMADALTIASLGSVELQHQIQQLYMNSHKKHYIRSIAFSIGSRDIPAYVKRSEVSRWKETLALIMTYCAPEHHIPTVRVLVDRLDNASMNQAAIICSLCCSDVDGAALQWQKQEHQRSGKSRIDALQSSVEKLYVMSQACGTTTGPSASGLYSEYAGLLSAQGAMSMALSFLQIAGSSTDELAFRIYYSGVSSQSMPAPPQPFYVKNVSSGRDSGHPISNRLPNAPGGLRRGPIPSQSSVGDSKPSSVPPQNRSSAPMVAPRGHPPSSMRPSYKPASGPGVAPGARPNSVPPQDSASSSSLPSRHLLNDNTHQGGHMNQFPTSGYNPSVGRAPQDVPSRAGSMPPSRAGASIPPSRGVQSYPPPGRGPSMGHPSPNQPMASRRPPAGPGMERATPSPSMSPAPRPSPSPGRFRPSAGIPPQRGGPMPPQRAGPLPPRGSQPPMQSASGIRHPPSPLRSSGVSPSFPPNQVSRPMPGRPGSGGMVDHQQFSAAAPPSRPGSMAPASRQPSPGPNRPPVRPGGVNGPSSSFPPNSSTGPMPTRPLPNHPPSALNPPPPQSRPAPLRPGITPPSSTPNFPQPSHHPSMNTPSQGQHHPLQAPSRPPNVPPQGHTAAHPGMNPPQRGPNQMQSPFRPGMSGGQPNANASVQPYANSPSPFPATSHAPMPPSAYHAHPPMPNPSRPASGTMPHPNLGRPTSGPNAQPNSHPGRPGAAPLRPSGPFRPSAGSSHLPPNQPPQMPNPARFPSSQSQSSINSLDAAAPRQSPVPFRSAPTRPGIPQPHRPNPNPDSSAPPHQRHQSPFTPSNGPTFQEQPSPFQQQQPHRNQIHQSASQPVLHDSFDGGFDDFTQSAESLPSDAFSDQSQQRVSAPAVPSAHHYSTPQNSSSNSNQHHSPTSRGSPSAPPRSPSNQTRLSPNSSFPRQPSPGRQSPGKPNDLVAVFQSSFADLHGLCNDPAEKTVVDNARLKFESEVYERITSGSYSASAMKSLESLANALQSHNKSGVQQANIALITDSWAEVKSILPVIKSIVEVCKKLFS